MRQSAKILLSEGSSLSARQTITALGMAGYRVDICTARKMCIGAFSRYVSTVHKVPLAATNPDAYLHAVLALLKKSPYDVLLPTHEQAFLFAAHQKEINQYTHLAIAPFAAFMQVQSKTASACLFDKLHLPQPAFVVAPSIHQIPRWHTFPAYAKLAYGTAGQSVWRCANLISLQELLSKLSWAAPDELLIQAEASAHLLCQAQALFSKGRLVALQCTQQQAIGIGNSQSARLGVVHPIVRKHIQKLGHGLGWHGPLAVDYLYDEQMGPQYIEVNPRLVEPMNAVFSGVNMAALTVELSLRGTLPVQADAKPGIVSSSLLASALGVASRSKSRLHILRAVAQAVMHSGDFRHSREDLTPLSDPQSLLPLLFVLLQVLLSPARAQKIASDDISQYALPASAIKRIIATQAMSQKG